jgi:hypothetical protein
MDRTMVALVFLVLAGSAGQEAAAQTLTASLAPSRTSCVAPCFVRFDATGTAAPTLTSIPFHEINYRWDFGDPNSGNWSTGAAAQGSSKWPRNRDYGPLAGHVFDPDRWADTYDQNATCTGAGTVAKKYVVTLLARYSNVASDSKTTTVCVAKPDSAWDASHTVCLFPSGGSAGTGCPVGVAPKAAAADACTTISSSIGAGTRVLLQAGSTFTCSGGITISAAGPGLLGSYGAGADPVVNMAGIATSSADWRIEHLDLRGPGNYNGVAISPGHILVYQISAQGFSNDVFSTDRPVGNEDLANSALVESTFPNCLFQNSGHACVNFIGGGKRLSLLGNHFVDASSAGHLTRVFQPTQFLYAHNEAGPTVNNVYTLLLLNCNDNESADQMIVLDNHFVLGTNNDGISGFSGGSGGVPEAVGFSNVLIESNFFDEQSGNHAAIREGCGNQVTVRNNLVRFPASWGKFWQIDSADQGSDTCQQSNVYGYNNSMYSPSGFLSAPGDWPIIAINGGSWSKVQLQNNLWWSDGQFGGGFVSCGGIASCTTSKNLSRSDGSLSSNPYPVASPSIPDDFKLKSNATAIDQAVTMPSLFLDFFRNLRAGAMDIGAAQYGAQADAAGTSSPPPPASPPPPPVLIGN